jgi:acetyltransferase-like isoleucine patch superfamily enzyme
MAREGGHSESAEVSTEALVMEHQPRSPVSRLLKFLARQLAVVLVTWRLLFYTLSRLLVDKDAAFAAASESIARIPGLRGVYLRQAFYRFTLAACGEDVYFGWMTVFSKTGARVGDGAYLGRRCSLGLVDLGANTMLSDGVQVLSGGRQHGTNADVDRLYKEQAQIFSRVRVGANVWLGTNSVIMADVGDSSVVGAGAVVIRPVPASCLAVGVPAEVKRKSGKAE